MTYRDEAERLYWLCQKRVAIEDIRDALQAAEDEGARHQEVLRSQLRAALARVSSAERNEIRLAGEADRLMREADRLSTSLRVSEDVRERAREDLGATDHEGLRDAAQRVVRERDEARAEVERLRKTGE